MLRWIIKVRRTLLQPCSGTLARSRSSREACSWSMPTEISATRPRSSHRAAYRRRRRDAERVQESSAQRPRAVVEVIHENLQLDREVDVVHGGADRHVQDLRRKIEQRVDS